METGTRISVIGCRNPHSCRNSHSHMKFLEEKVSLYTYRTYCVLLLSF